MRQSHKTEKRLIFNVILKKNEQASSTEQNVTVAIQSVYSKVGILAAKFPQSHQLLI